MEDEFETSAYPPLRTRKIDLLFVGVSFVKDVASAVTEAIGDVQQLVAMHANWQVERSSFTSRLPWSWSRCWLRWRTSEARGSAAGDSDRAGGCDLCSVKGRF